MAPIIFIQLGHVLPPWLGVKKSWKYYMTMLKKMANQ